MKRFTLAATLLMAVAAFPPGASAQNVFKCGDSYSQSPCPGGTVIDAGDSRNPAQKAQADAAIARDARTAEALEKTRLKQEALARTAPAPSEQPAANEAPATTGKTGATKETQNPGYFTAQAAGEKKKKKKGKKAKPAQTSQSHAGAEQAAKK